jgi:RNA polymerase sigma-70 factor (ECF subfamily)
MTDSTSADSGQTRELLERARQGDQQSWSALFERHRRRLRKMVALRMDRRLQGRIDPSDVIQEAYIEAYQRLADYLREPPASFFLWLRYLSGQKLLECHRRHLGRKVRDAAREVSLYRGSLPGASSAALAAQLMGRLTRPSVAAMRAEMKIRLQDALNSMDDLDREVLVLRHFEQLSNGEAAQVLGLHESATSKRYVRALRRLREILTSLPGDWGDLRP